MNCIKCGSVAKKVCAKCSTRYCSADCQRADWGEHKAVCSEIAEKKFQDAIDAMRAVASVGHELPPANDLQKGAYVKKSDLIAALGGDNVSEAFSKRREKITP